MDIMWKTSNGIVFAGVGKPQCMFWEIVPNDPDDPNSPYWVSGFWGPKGPSPMFRFVAVNLTTAKEMVRRQLELSRLDEMIEQVK
jgi:hypothetical protein